jgi:hypothetical protein
MNKCFLLMIFALMGGEIYAECTKLEPCREEMSKIPVKILTFSDYEKGVDAGYKCSGLGNKPANQILQDQYTALTENEAFQSNPTWQYVIDQEILPDQLNQCLQAIRIGK